GVAAWPARYCAPAGGRRPGLLLRPDALVIPARTAGNGIAFPAPGERRRPAPAVAADSLCPAVPAACRSCDACPDVRGRLGDRPLPGIRRRARRLRREPALSGDQDTGRIRRAGRPGRSGSRGPAETLGRLLPRRCRDQLRRPAPRYPERAAAPG